MNGIDHRLADLARRHFGGMEDLPAGWMSFLSDASQMVRGIEQAHGALLDERLHPSEVLLQEVMHVAQIGVFDHDHVAGVLYCSPNYRSYYGWAPGDPITLQSLVSAVHPEDREWTERAIRAAHDPGGNGRYDLEHRIVRRDGRIRWLIKRSQSFFAGEGPDRKVIRTIGVAMDVTEQHEAEAALRESEERLRLALKAANQHLYDLDIKTGESAVILNDASEMAYPPMTIHETHPWWLDKIHPSDLDAIRSAFAKCVTEQSSEYRVEFRRRVQNGGWRWILSVGRIVEHDEEGKPVRLVGTHTDITPRKEAETVIIEAQKQLEERVAERTRQLSEANASLRESEARSRSILENVQAGIFVVDPETREVLDANSVALALMGRSAAEVIGRPCHGTVCPAPPQSCPVIDSGKTIRNCECEILDATGSSVPVLKNVVQITLNGRPVLLESFVDITERKRAQTELEQAKLAAEAASEAKSRFLAVMSHEIRTPLNGVTGVLRLLEQEELSPRQRRWIEMAGQSAVTLLKILNGILDFSKAEAGKVELHVAGTDLHAAIKGATHTYLTQAAAKGLAWSLEIAPDVPQMAELDQERLSQILGNLLSNALKFTDQGSIRLRISLCSAEMGVKRLRFEVTDTGPGISLEGQRFLFQPFSQVDDSTTRRHGGTGLGLVICRQLVELMGGTIGVQTACGEGSTFWFEIPVRPARPCIGPDHTEGAVKPGSPAPERPGIRVLLAEDNEINQELARAMIQFAGYNCDCVVNGQEAVTAALTGEYSLIFMDCMMPAMDGYQATRHIRQAAISSPEAQRARVPIIAMTANAMEGDREKCLTSGMDDYLSKPLDPVLVAAMLERWIRADGDAAVPEESRRANQSHLSHQASEV